jgi:hypothetical protein
VKTERWWEVKCSSVQRRNEVEYLGLNFEFCVWAGRGGGFCAENFEVNIGSAA